MKIGFVKNFRFLTFEEVFILYCNAQILNLKTVNCYHTTIILMSCNENALSLVIFEH